MLPVLYDYSAQYSMLLASCSWVNCEQSPSLMWSLTCMLRTVVWWGLYGLSVHVWVCAWLDSALTVSQTESCTPTMYIYGVQALGRRELRVPILLVLAREILQVQYSYRTTSLCFHNEIGCCFSFMAAIQLPPKPFLPIATPMSFFNLDKSSTSNSTLA